MGYAFRIYYARLLEESLRPLLVDRSDQRFWEDLLSGRVVTFALSLLNRGFALDGAKPLIHRNVQVFVLIPYVFSIVLNLCRVFARVHL